MTKRSSYLIGRKSVIIVVIIIAVIVSSYYIVWSITKPSPFVTNSGKLLDKFGILAIYPTKLGGVWPIPKVMGYSIPNPI